MYIRFPTLADLNACFHLDAQVETEHVWQLQRTVETDRVVATLQRVRLPRPMRVPYLALDDSLLVHYKQRDGLWVAVEEGQVLGFVDVTWQPVQEVIWVNHLVVDRPWRQQGVGTALLERTLQVAVERGMMRALVTVNTKNDPAIRFFQKHGFTCAGYNDAYLGQGDIAIYLARSLSRWPGRDIR